MTAAYDLWVDFNGVTADNIVTTLERFKARDDVLLEPGVELVVGDDDGASAIAVVHTMHDGLVCLELLKLLP